MQLCHKKSKKASAEEETKVTISGIVVQGVVPSKKKKNPSKGEVVVREEVPKG